MNRHFSFGLLVVVLSILNPTQSQAQGFLNTIKKQVQNEAERAAQRKIEQATKDAAAAVDQVIKDVSDKHKDEKPEVSTTTPRERRAAERAAESAERKSAEANKKRYEATKPVSRTLVFEPGVDPRFKYNPFYPSTEETKQIKEAYEEWREKPEAVIAAAGPDSIWQVIQKEAAAKSELCLEMSIQEGKDISQCVSSQQAQEVVHLKVTGRLYKWEEFNRFNELYEFLLTLPKLKSLNLRDLDCEAFVSNSKTPFNTIVLDRLVLPLNCTEIFSSFHTREIVFPPKLLSFSRLIYGLGGITRQQSVVDIRGVERLIIPEGIDDLGAISIHKGTKSITFPAAFTFADGIHIDDDADIEEIHMKGVSIPMHKEQSKFGINDAYIYGDVKHFQRCTLYVPENAEYSFRHALRWRSFHKIIGVKVTPNIGK